MRTIKSVLAIVSLLFLVGSCGTKRSENRIEAFTSKIIFPYQGEHVHGSTIVELPNGDLLSAWFQGSGERWADDVKIMGSRLVKGDTAWSKTFVMADVDGFPDINPIMFMDLQQRLWLMWYQCWRINGNPQSRCTGSVTTIRVGAPVWSWQDVLFVKVGDKTERGIQPGDRL